VTELSAGVTYHFAVKAVNAAGDSNMSNFLSAAVIGAPGAPTALTATSSVGKVDLTWQRPTADGGSPIIGYKVYRAVSGSAVLLAQVGAATLAFTDNNGTAGTIYTYYVMASNSVGTSVSSVPVSAAAQSSPTDNTMLIVVVAIMAIGAIAVAAYALRRK
jgi:predicted phage tail protein